MKVADRTMLLPAPLLTCRGSLNPKTFSPATNLTHSISALFDGSLNLIVILILYWKIKVARKLHEYRQSFYFLLCLKQIKRMPFGHSFIGYSEMEIELYQCNAQPLLKLDSSIQIKLLEIQFTHFYNYKTLFWTLDIASVVVGYSKRLSVRDGQSSN